MFAADTVRLCPRSMGAGVLRPLEKVRYLLAVRREQGQESIRAECRAATSGRHEASLTSVVSQRPALGISLSVESGVIAVQNGGGCYSAAAVPRASEHRYALGTRAPRGAAGYGYGAKGEYRSMSWSGLGYSSVDFRTVPVCYRQGAWGSGRHTRSGFPLARE